jgi:hypothetical protein
MAAIPSQGDELCGLRPSYGRIKERHGRASDWVIGTGLAQFPNLKRTDSKYWCAKSNEPQCDRSAGDLFKKKADPEGSAQPPPDRGQDV